MSENGPRQVRFDVEGDSMFYQTEEAPFPSTRYQGNKSKLIDWVWNEIRPLGDSIIDLFAGTGAIAHTAKRHGYQVHYNDFLKFNHHVGRALIENDTETLTEANVDALLDHDPEARDYPTFIQDTFGGLYYKDDENAWLDAMHVHISEMDSQYKQSLAYTVLAQACISKRPYGLFHRANLDARTRDVDRSFGNKTTWEKSFPKHFREFVPEFNRAVHTGAEECFAHNEDATEWELPEADILYLDPPYYSEDNGTTDYHYHYHFLEGFCEYDSWGSRLTTDRKTKPVARESESPWKTKEGAIETLEGIIARWDGAVAVSSNTDSHPNDEELEAILGSHRDEVEVHYHDHQYGYLSEGKSSEVLAIGY